MYLKEEFRKSPAALCDLLNWSHFVENGILQLSDGSLQVTWHYDGRDMDSMSKADRRDLTTQIAKVLNLGERWVVETNAMRRQVQEYLPASPWAHPVARTIDYERSKQFHEPGIFFRTHRFITLTYAPRQENETRMQRWLGGHQNNDERESDVVRQEKHRAAFLERIDRFESDFGNFVPCQRLRATSGDNLVLRFLRECLLGEDFPFPDPTIPIGLNRLFRRALTTGTAPILDGNHIRVLAVDSFPNASWPGMFRALEHIQLPYRWHTRMSLMDPISSRKMHDRHFKMWRGAERGIASQLFNWNKDRPSGDAVEMKLNADQAATVASRAEFLFGMWNAKIVLMSENLHEIKQWRREIEQTIKPLGFGLRLEYWNATDSWRATLPGHFRSDCRAYSVTTENLADGMPLAVPFTGFKQNPSPHMPPGSPALFVAATDGNTPYYGNQHVGQVELVNGKPEAEKLNSLMTGETRAGKSFELGFRIISWLTRYPNSQVYAFDKKFSMRNLVWALNGVYYPFGGNDAQLQLAPLIDIDTEEDLAWASNWLETLCLMRGLQISPRAANDLSEGLKKLAGRPRNRRSLTEFLVQLRNPELTDALQHYTGASAASGGLLDGQEDALGTETFCDFEMEYLMAMDRRILRAVLLYLFRRIAKRLDSRRPTLIPIDEAWTALDDEYFSGIMASWLRELNKLNAGVILCTQNTGDFLNTPLKQVILNQCSQRIYLPTPSAKRASHADYVTLGLNEQQIDRIANGTQKRDYCAQTPNGFQQYQLFAGAVMKAFLGKNGSADRERIAQLRALHPQDWQAYWLRECGLPEWADHLEGLFEEERAKAEWQTQTLSMTT